MIGKRIFGRKAAALFLGPVLFWPALLFGQSIPDAEGLVSELTRPPSLTRGLAALPRPTPSMQEFLTQLPTRGLTIEARVELVEITEEFELPRIDLDIPFDFNSDGLRNDVMVNLVTLGQALTSPELSESRFVVAGHTDGVGSAAYNQDLSDRRAAAVRQFLLEAFEIDEKRLIAVGFGFEQLANASDPEAGENRRVEIINLEVGIE